MFFVDLESEILKVANRADDTFSIGKTICGRDIWCAKVGKVGKKVIAQYAIHAREYITAWLAVLHMQEMIDNYTGGIVYFVPIANPDGVALCLDGLDSIMSMELRSELSKVNNSQDFSLWKANARCVDLNVNFDANWGQGEYNVLYKSRANYIGEYAGSEDEVKALENLTDYVRPDATISYHSKGEEIYYEFGQNEVDKFRDKRIAEALANVTGYKIKSQGNSVGGYKDWCITKYHIPSFTIEIGKDEYVHPINKDKIPEIWQQNKFVLKKLLALL